MSEIVSADELPENIQAKAPPAVDVRLRLRDNKLPIVMLFGPANAGKTTGLLRLAHYLNKKEYNITVDYSFRDDPYYTEYLAPNFTNLLKAEQPESPPNTVDSAFIALNLKSVTHNKAECKFVEVPGEHLFNISKPARDQEFPAYMQDIFTSNARKVFIFLLPIKPDEIHGGQSDLSDAQFNEYCEHIQNVIRGNLNIKRDSYFFVIPKADLHKDKLHSATIPNMKLFEQTLESRTGYQKLLKFVKNIGGKMEVVPFSSGAFSRGSGGINHLIFSEDEWPKRLWDAVDRRLMGDGIWAIIRSLFGRN